VAEEQALFGHSPTQAVPDSPLNEGDHVRVMLKYLAHELLECRAWGGRIKSNSCADGDTILWESLSQLSVVQINNAVLNSEQERVRVPVCARV
jgi:hypothetical protein